MYVEGMDEFVKQGHWWWLLIVPVATFVFALLGSLWGSNLGKITKHKQWFRNQKQAAYQKFVAIAQANSHNVYASLSDEKSSDGPEHENCSGGEARSHDLTIRWPDFSSTSDICHLPYICREERLRHPSLVFDFLPSISEYSLGNRWVAGLPSPRTNAVL